MKSLTRAKRKGMSQRNSKRKHDLTDLISRLAPVAYSTLREEYTRDCCIAAAAILRRVFEVHGYTAEVIPVTVEVYNPEMSGLFKRGFKIDKNRDRTLMEITGAWSVGIVPASATLSAVNRVPGGGYGGHLLLRVCNFLIDPTIKQVDRPDKNITMPEMIATPHAEDLVRDDELRLDVGGCLVRYQPLNDHSYVTAPDWVRRSSPYPETVRRILTRLEA